MAPPVWEASKASFNGATVVPVLSVRTYLPGTFNQVFRRGIACTGWAVRGCPQADDMPLFSVSWRRPTSPAAPPRPQERIRALACR